MTDDATTPVLKVVNADATPEEIAAIVALFSSMGGASAPPQKVAPAWSANFRRLRPQHPHGPGGWRASGLPR